MAEQTSIEWTDKTWTPVKGCTRVSEGCRNCYAEIMTARFSGPGMWGEGLAEIVATPSGKDHRWTGRIKLDEAELLKPLRWRKPSKIFVCSTSDLFHADVPDDFIDKVFAVMALCPQHSFQVLTKRPERMRDWFRRYDTAHDHNCADFVADAIAQALGRPNARGAERTDGVDCDWPLRNVWLGTSVENQAAADERIPHLLATPAKVRWLSCEPLLGPVDLKWALSSPIILSVGFLKRGHFSPGLETLRRIDWVVAGGESGHGARPMHPDWARSLRDQCAAAGVPFLFKQWGDWRPQLVTDSITFDTSKGRGQRTPAFLLKHDGTVHCFVPEDEPCAPVIFRLGKKKAGRLLDGVQHDGYPG